ncbi:DNA-directed RNA polymerase subunit alpha C-terminal domain-containing protein [Mucilaginibacter sp. P25]|uniref:RNA polymerase, alpha chain C terminal domain n=1 Tax=Mucilaginibacter gossypii TaxID=551996 RepID=A0A1G7VTI6_9SPHI|nr:DNA-directed RNA polymerase subunit alpha C-terminal domain-containing protein [Mucilaginibacter gossypii]SDG63073.1 RNA polymerase, alpha chain C terminal domain [Mucilaginibacter gossypii]
MKTEESNSPFGKLGNPARRALANAGITSLLELSKLTEKEFLHFHGVGKSSVPIVKEKMKEKGLGFRE